MDLQSDSALAAHYGLEEVYGIPRLSEEQFIKKVRAITPKQIQEACRRYLVEPFMVHAIVG
jgi:predicted Zn-dependent peptidase